MATTPIIPIEFQFEDKGFKELTSQMNKLYKDAKKFSDLLKSGSGDTKKTTDGLKKTTTEMEKLTKKMDNYNKEAKDATGYIHKMELNMKALKVQQRLALDPAKAKAYGREINNIRKNIAKAKDTTGTWGKALGSFQFKFNALGNIAANVASGIQRKVGQALKDVVKTTIEFEKSFAAVLTLLDKGQKDQYGGFLKQTSIDIMKKYGLAVEDTNKAMFDAISAGVKVADVYSVLDAAARLAVGGVTDLNSATKGIASVMNAFSLSMDEAGNVASAFFQAQKFGITYIDEMVASMGRANTIASLAGASYRDMLAAFTAITKSGLNTEEAITGLRNVFKELVASSGEAAAELSRLGIATGSNAVKARGFIGVLDDLNRAYINNNEVIPKIFGNIRGLTGIMGIVGKRYESFKFILEQVNDVMASNESLAQAVGEQMGTTAKKVDLLKAAWDGFIISLTDGQSEQGSTIKELIDGLTNLVSYLTPSYYEEYTKAINDATVAADGLIKKEKEKAESDEHIKALEDAKVAAENLQKAYDKINELPQDERAEAYKKNGEEIKTLTKIMDDANIKAAASDEEYIDKLLIGIQAGVDAEKTALDEKQAIYIASNEKLKKLQEKAEKEKTTVAGVDFKPYSVERTLLEEQVDRDKIAFIGAKTIYDGLFALLDKLLAKEIDNANAKKVLSDQDRKRQLSLLKLQRDVEIAKVKIKYDGITESIKAENIRYDFEKQIIEKSNKHQEEKDLLLEKNQLTHDAKMLDIKRKYAKEGIDIDSQYNIASINVTKHGHDKQIALAEEANSKKLALIENSNNEEVVKQKKREIQALEHEKRLTDIAIKYAILRINTQKNIDIAEATKSGGDTHSTKLAIMKIEFDAELALIDKMDVAFSQKIKLRYKAQLDYDNKTIKATKNRISTITALEGKGAVLDAKLLGDTWKTRKEIINAEFDARRANIELIEDEILRKLELLNLEKEYALALKDLGAPKSIGDMLGFSEEEQDALNMGIDALQDFTDQYLELTEKRIDAVQREIDASDERMRSLQSDRDHEWERMQEGYANNYALKQQEIEDERLRQVELAKQEREAIRNKKKAADAQVAINLVIEVSNLAVAGAMVFADGIKKAGIAGIALGIAGVALLLGSFMAFKANAAEATGYAEGVIDLGGAGTEKSDSISARLSRGESVMTAKTTKQNKRTLGFMQDNPTHPLFKTIEKHGVNNVFNKLSDDMQNNWTLLNTQPDNKWDEKMYNELKSGNEELRNRPYSYMKGGKLYTVEGNNITQTTIRHG